MNTKAVTLGLIFLLSPALQASAQTSDVSNSVESHLNEIVSRVRDCSVLPVSYSQDGVKTLHALESHCPEVKTLTGGSAEVKVASHAYSVVLVASPDSDGDFYDVQIKDIASSEIHTLPNVLAYGDVLLGILNGNTNGLKTVLVSDPAEIQMIDANLKN